MQRVKATNVVENDYQYGLVIYPAKNNEKINSFFNPVKPCKMADIRNKGFMSEQKLIMVHQQTSPSIIAIILN